MHVDAQRPGAEGQRVPGEAAAQLGVQQVVLQLCPVSTAHWMRVLQKHWQAVLWPGRPPLLCLLSCLPRYGNPTTRVLEEKIAALEGAEDCVVGVGTLGAAAVWWP